MNPRSILLPLMLVPIAVLADDEDVPCVIPRGPPCITPDDPRLKDPACRLDEDACISIQWDEYSGNTIIEQADIFVTPACGRMDSTPTLEKKGRAYLESLQTIPFEVRVIENPCKAKGFVDIKVTKFRTGAKANP